MPGGVLADGAARARIENDIATTLFVDAGAGSGKTTALVKRYRTLVLDGGVPVRNIAAVTFTEKAGAELRDRLREAFEEDAATGEAERRGRAAEAVEELDAAAIGTLHSFARRILAEHPIEAGIPPAFEVTDEIGSSVAFENRWEAIRDALLDDAAASRLIAVALSLGVSLDHLRDIAVALNRNWDLIAGRILDAHEAGEVSRGASGEAGPAAGGGSIPSIPSTPWRALAQQAAMVGDLAAECRDRSDKLCGFVERIGEAAQVLMESEGEPAAVVAVLRGVEKNALKQSGRKANWPDIASVRAARRDFVESAVAALEGLAEGVLRGLVRYLAEKIRRAALDRVCDGALEYHDLLVTARGLVRGNADVREALHGRYQRLLLDEFQDTDPIQIDIAARIAGGGEAEAADWQDIDIPAGRLFVVGDPKQSIYRFRRADIATYLSAAGILGEHVTLSTNFRTTAPIIDWINGVFAPLMSYEAGVQPEYEPVHSFRSTPLEGPAVSVTGAEPLATDTPAADLQAAEAADVAAAIARAVPGWEVFDGNEQRTRPARYDDIAVLLPTRTSLDTVEEALDAAGIPYHAEASSLVYSTPAVRDLLMCARAVADPVDELALVTTLRSPLFGCGDDDLWRWRRGGGKFRLHTRIDTHPEADGPVGSSLDYLGRLSRDSRWLTPPELLGAIIRDRRILEVAATGARRAEVWRRLRFVVDQAQGFADAAGGGVRDYLSWVALQAEGGRRVSESIAGERGLDSVRILTVHAAKGLEYPIVALAGMSVRPRTASGVQLEWPPAGGWELQVKAGLGTHGFTDAAAEESAKAAAERIRLLYVAATRARDHLIVGLHRTEKAKLGANPTPAELLAAHDAAGHGATGIAISGQSIPGPGTSGAWPAPQDFPDWQGRAARARDASRISESISASSLEGTAGPPGGAAAPGFSSSPDSSSGSDSSADSAVPAEVSSGDGQAGPSGGRGAPQRYGPAVGTAVHAVLQAVDLSIDTDAAEFAAVVHAQCVAEGVTGEEAAVAAMARAALESDLVRTAAAGDHWRETFVGVPAESVLPAGGQRPAGQVLEGFIDLVFRAGGTAGEDPGRLVIVDYKTDEIGPDGYAAKDEFYRPQIEAYAKALGTATGTAPSAYLLYLRPEGATARRIPT